jgi:hypothetical protein
MGTETDVTLGQTHGHRALGRSNNASQMRHPQPRPQGPDRHRRAGFLHPRLAHLFQAQCDLYGSAGPVAMDQAAGEVVLLEAMEAAAHAPPQAVGTGSRSRNGAHGDAEPQRLLADEPE